MIKFEANTRTGRPDGAQFLLDTLIVLTDKGAPVSYESGMRARKPGLSI